ncbi:MAG: hypothetical protein KJ718_05270 [Nanoarchaeota archaeon]|nr:hypothetical protein [Nanoarchaeota archaeon]MBU1051936.1 hypothetical protein [Nanoarchaeota archaeon]MBU1988048.1 hypothetical protein [Nanoarchaeota archaeon]
MGRWTWILIALGVLLILTASFAFDQGVTTHARVIMSPEDDPTSHFQLLLGIFGLVAVVWGIVTE